MKTLIFYADRVLVEHRNTATTYTDFHNKIKDFDGDTFTTNESSCLSFDMFKYVDLIIIVNASNTTLTFEKHPDGVRVNNTVGSQKEIRLSHNLFKLWTSSWKDL